MSDLHFACDLGNCHLCPCLLRRVSECAKDLWLAFSFLGGCLWCTDCLFINRGCVCLAHGATRPAAQT